MLTKPDYKQVKLKTVPMSLQGFEDKGIQETTYQEFSLFQQNKQYLLVTSNKQRGIEPGFEAVVIDEKLWEVINKLTKDKDALKNHLEDAKKNLEMKIEKQMKEGIISKDTILHNHHDALKKLLKDFDNIYDELSKTENHKLKSLQNNKKLCEDLSIIIRESKNDATVLMYKQNYDEPSKNDYVFITQDRLDQLGRKDGGTYKTRQKANMSAVLECLANDIAIAYGASAQIQKLICTRYKNDSLKFMTCCELIQNYDDLSGSQYTLTGDMYKPLQKKGLFKNYLVNKEDEGKIGAMSTNPPLIGSLLALMISMQERDFIGAYGQNKGIVKGLPFIIDLGKAYDKDHGIIETLQDNGQFDEPYVWLPLDCVRRHFLFRNVSLSYDVPFHETMLGFHLLNKLVTGKIPSKEIIESYNEKYQNIKGISKNYIAELFNTKAPNLEKIFDSHIDNLKSMKENATSKNQENELEQYINQLENTKKRALSDAKKILKKFESRLALKANEVNFLSNMEKLTSPMVYDLSEDGKTLIKHLQVDSNSRIPWELEKKDNDYILSVNLNKNPNFRSQKPIFLSNIANSAMKKGMNFIEEQLNLVESVYEEKLALKGQISIKIPEKQFLKLCEKTTDDLIHKKRMPLFAPTATIVSETQKLIETYREEQSKYTFFDTFKNSVGDVRSKVYIDLLKQENPIIQLTALIGLMSSGSTNLKKSILSNFKCENSKEGINRVEMRIRAELREYFKDENLSEKTIEKIVKKLKDTISNYNIEIEQGLKTNNSYERTNIIENLNDIFNNISNKSNSLKLNIN